MTTHRQDANATQSKPPIVLTIAGFDPSSGAGMTADLQVFAANGLFGTSAITAITVQNTLGVAATEPINSILFRQTLANLSADLTPAGIKIGMLGTAPMVRELVDFLKVRHELKSQNLLIPIVLDPIIRSSSGASLLDSEGLRILRQDLLKLVTWITPNWQELALLTDLKVANPESATIALQALGSEFPHLTIIATGGDQQAPTDLLRLPSGEIHAIPGIHVETTSTHGTGCAFSSALLSRLVLGDTPVTAATAAKAFVEGALRHAPGLGKGRGPMDLLWTLRSC